ncbi:MAG: hypothetical protein U1F37_05355 [Alphaproteobacteria bacterium]
MTIMTNSSSAARGPSRRIAAVFGLALGSIGMAPNSASAESVSFTVAPYLWVTSASANIAIGGASTQIHKSFFDLLRESETAFAFSGYGAVHYGNWSFFLEGLYSRLTADTNLGPLPTQTRSITSLLDFGLSYRLGMVGVPGSGGWAMSLEPYVGGRYVNLSTRIQGGFAGPAGGARTIDVNKSFSGVDPIFGARLMTEIDQRWRVTLAGDVGGGAATNLTWSASGLLGYRFEMGGVVSTLWLGYKALGIDLNTGGNLPLRVNQVLHGPVIGSSFRF